jgi:hypothetical protein
MLALGWGCTLATYIPHLYTAEREIRSRKGGVTCASTGGVVWLWAHRPAMRGSIRYERDHVAQQPARKQLVKDWGDAIMAPCNSDLLNFGAQRPQYRPFAPITGSERQQ